MHERNLIRGLRQHKPQALETLITEYTPYVSVIVRNIIGRYLAEADVEEVTADVFVTAWEHAHEIQSGKLSSYLAAVARNRAKNRIRSYHEVENIEDYIEICSGDDVERTIDQKLLSELLRDVLCALSAKDREILVRYYYYYESVCQIAEDLHMSQSAVKQRMCRARKKLQQELISRGYSYEDAPEMQMIRFPKVKKGVTP